MNKYSFVFIVLTVLFFSVVLKTISDWVYLLFLLSWFLYNKTKKVDGRYSVAAGLIFLFFCPLVLVSDSQLAQKFASFAFIFLISGIFLLFYEKEK